MLLQTKLNMPLQQGNLVQRTEVSARFDELLHKDLAIVCAPPGYGKTTVVRQWLSNTKHSFCWLSIDTRDNDPGIFWRYICASFSRVSKRLSDRLMVGHEPQGNGDIQLNIDALLNELIEYSRTWKSPDQIILVLDDYHFIHNQAIHEQLCYFIDYCPRLLKIIITSRSEPELELPKRRVRNQLVEVSSQHLQFSQEDCQTFLSSTFSLMLSPLDLKGLYKKTEGWIAAIQLAGLSLQNKIDKTHFIEQFTGRESSLSSYLLAEVYDQQSPHIQNFLINIAIIPRFCEPLCSAIIGQENSQTLINELKHKNLFITPLDDEGYWFRLHDLFRDWLIKKLVESSLSDTLEVRKHAAHWFEEQNLFMEAIDQILEIKDWLWASRLTGKIMPDLIRNGDHVTCDVLGKRFPEYFAKTQPKLCALQAFAYFFNEKYDAAQQLIQEAEQQLYTLQKRDNIAEYLQCGFSPDEDIDELIVLLMIFRSQFYNYTGRVNSSQFRLISAIPKKDLSSIAKRSPAVKSWWHYELGHEQFKNNQFIDAEVNLIKAIQSAKMDHDRFCIATSFSWLVPVLYHQGKIESGLRLITELEDVLTPSSHTKLLNSGVLDYGRAAFYCEKDLKDEAIQAHNNAVEKWAGKIDPINQIYLTYQGLLLDLSFGSTDDALKALDEIERIYNRHFSVWTFEAPSIDVMRAIVHLISGDSEELFLWAEKFEKSNIIESTHRNEDEALIYTRVLLMQGKDIRPFIHDIRNKAIAGGSRSREIECWILEAYYFGLKKEKIKSFRAFRKALRLGAKNGFIRKFLAEGDVIKPLLKAAIKYKVETSYAKDLLLQLDKSKTKEIVDATVRDGPSLVEQLSDREIQVLKLINDGNSNNTISLTLNVAPTTVKTHVRNIYSKLGVNRRTQALASAREYGIL